MVLASPMFSLLACVVDMSLCKLTLIPYVFALYQNLGALDGFTAAKPATPIKPTSTKKAEGAKSPKTDNPARTPEALLLNPELNEDDDDSDIDVSTDAEFQKSMAMGMEELMREMSSNSELQKTFDEMFKGMDLDLEKKGSVPTEGSPTQAKAPETTGSFQDRIAKTMDKLKDSSEQVEVGTTGHVLFFFWSSFLLGLSWSRQTRFLSPSRCMIRSGCWF